MDYKKYSLENLENWLYDALSCGEASPHEIYSVIRKVVQDQYNYHKEQSQKCSGLLELLSGHRPVKLECDKDDPSPECQSAWNDFWEQSYLSGVTDTPEEAEELRVEIEKMRGEGGFEWTPTDEDIEHSKYYYEYNRNDPNRKAPMYHPV
ncbi:MAG: hypothetical protein EBU90_08510 [Proteobacteria bacterium]|nr:hypothetical protein [Pseudomonadota bacterium]